MLTLKVDGVGTTIQASKQLLRCQLCGNKKEIFSMEGVSEQRATTPFHYYFKSQWRGGKKHCKCEEIFGVFFVFFLILYVRKGSDKTCLRICAEHDRKHALNNIRSFPCCFSSFTKNIWTFYLYFPHIKRNRSSCRVAFTAPMWWAQTVKFPSMQAYLWALSISYTHPSTFKHLQKKRAGIQKDITPSRSSRRTVHFLHLSPPAISSSSSSSPSHLPSLPFCWPDKGRSLHHRPPLISHLLWSKGQAKAQLQLGWL